MGTHRKLDIPTLAQATTDGLAALSLVVARVTGEKHRVVELLDRYATVLDSGSDNAGAQMVREMSRVVGEIKD